MYSEDAITFSKTDDGGYVVNVRVKVKKSKEGKGEVCCSSDRDAKTLVASDDKELMDIIKKLLPDMKPGGMEEDEFEEAFGDAVKEEKES